MIFSFKTEKKETEPILACSFFKYILTVEGRGKEKKRVK